MTGNWRYVSAMMMCAIRNPRLLVIGTLLAAGLLLPILGSIP
jgi:hypothetical protein